MLYESARRAMLAAALTMVAWPAAAQDSAVQAFFRKTIGLTEAQAAEIEAGRVVTRQLPGADKPEMAAFGAVRIAAKKDLYLERLRDIVRFRKGPSTLQIGRFHTPPVVADLEGLTLEDGDFEAARKVQARRLRPQARALRPRPHPEGDGLEGPGRPGAGDGADEADAGGLRRGLSTRRNRGDGDL
jgi:hypothetical protein